MLIESDQRLRRHHPDTRNNQQDGNYDRCFPIIARRNCNIGRHHEEQEAVILHPGHNQRVKETERTDDEKQLITRIRGVDLSQTLEGECCRYNHEAK